MNKIPNPLLWLALLVLAALSVYYFLPRTAPAVVGETRIAAPAREVVLEPKAAVQVAAGVKAYRPAVKTKLRLPEAVVANAAEHVISTAKVPNDDRPHTVTTTLNVDTGESTSYVRTDPLPWMAKNFSGEFGMYAGYKNGGPAVRLQARQSVLDIKAVRFGVVGSVDQSFQGAATPEFFVGVGAWYRW